MINQRMQEKSSGNSCAARLIRLFHSEEDREQGQLLTCRNWKMLRASGWVSRPAPPAAEFGEVVQPGLDERVVQPVVLDTVHQKHPASSTDLQLK